MRAKNNAFFISSLPTRSNHSSLVTLLPSVLSNELIAKQDPESGSVDIGKGMAEDYSLTCSGRSYFLCPFSPQSSPPFRAE